MKILVVKLDQTHLAQLEYIGISHTRIQQVVDEVVTERIRKLIWDEVTGEEATCASCGTTLGWCKHADDCRYNDRNLPEHLKGKFI